MSSPRTTSASSPNSGSLAAVEAEASGHPLGAATWERLCAMADSAAALVDEQLRPPRQGDSDEGRALLLDAPVPNRWPSLLALADALVGRLDWWPRSPADAGSVIIGALAGAKHPSRAGPTRRPSRFADAGSDAAADRRAELPEIWCRCDGGPHGYLSIAAHAHADALSVEVRYAGVEILADPGTYCYHGEPAWRSYFRSTIAHNTVELGGRSQSSEGGPFMWARHAQAREVEVIDDGDIASWTAEHDGYASLDPPARHRRSVLLDRASRSLDIIDEIDGGSHEIRLAFHLGPEVQAELDGSCAVLGWPAAAALGRRGWNCRRGCGGACIGARLTPSSAGTPLAWVAAFPPSRSWVAAGACPALPLATRLEFLEAGQSAEPLFPGRP